MESFGILGLIPPVLTIALAFITKDVIVSLFLGILSGALIVAGGNPITAVLNLTDGLANVLVDGWNIRIFLFCALLGGLVGMLSRTGSSRAFGRWAAKKINSPKTSMLMAWFCGILIFIDDYFNSLAVGTIMRPITDKNNVSRAKLSYILDCTAAPVCILVPISSWVITVMSYLRDSEGFSVFADAGINEFSYFIRSVPYNVYALLTLIMVLYLAISGKDFGPMKKSESLAKKGILFNEEYGDATGEVVMDGDEKADKARGFDMLLPIIVLVASALIMFPMTTYLSTASSEGISLSAAMGTMTLGDAFNNTDASVALFYSAIITIFISYVYYLCRGLFSIKEASEALIEGIKSMVPALIILVMAWTIGGIIKSSPADGGLGLASYLSEVVVGGGFPLGLVPFIVFVLSALTAFATGTSWGTFAIMIPITMPIAVGLGQAMNLEFSALLNSTLICTSAVLGGAVFGDHASPISDSTILSSTGAGCPHLEHVATQLPYAITVAVCTGIGFLAGGLAQSLLWTWIVTLAVFAAAMIFLPKFLGDKSFSFKK
ncbi:MAG: Na+/H+ antiporter NhaC family protein [Spirochaetales bacterium]|nr:Na+/H+ antiporter NhaC family protein [Spirochaetales bacterium]